MNNTRVKSFDMIEKLLNKCGVNAFIYYLKDEKKFCIDILDGVEEPVVDDRGYFLFSHFVISIIKKYEYTCPFRLRIGNGDMKGNN